jgi:amidophosphoribosyltransferase
MAGLLGHGDSFVFRDPRDTSRLLYQDDEVVVVVLKDQFKLFFNVAFEDVHEIDPEKP